jgi:hypothetical protein
MWQVKRFRVVSDGTTDDVTLNEEMYQDLLFEDVH